MTKQDDPFPTHGLRGRSYQRVYRRLFAMQGGKCAICGRPPGKRDDWSHVQVKLVIDHCHKSGKIRGLVCTGCNNQLAFTEHERIRMRPKYRAYLESRANVGWSDEQ